MPSFLLLRTADRRKSCGVSPVYVPYRPFFLALSPVLSSLPNPARTQAFCHALRKQPTGKITPIRRLSGIFFKRSTTVASSGIVRGVSFFVCSSLTRITQIGRASCRERDE